MTVRAAKLNHKGIFVGMDELPEDHLTPLHLRQITDCDLPPNRYRWVEDAAAPFGGRFVPLTRKELGEVNDDPTITEAHILRGIMRGFIAIRDGEPLPDDTLKVLAWYEQSFDNKG